MPITFRILDREKYGLSSPVILGAETYIGAKCKRQEHAELAFGYSFEKLVLFATTLGLGTACLAATLDRPASNGNPARFRRHRDSEIGTVDFFVFALLRF